MVGEGHGTNASDRKDLAGQLERTSLSKLYLEKL